MKKYMDELYARLEELSEKPLTLGHIEEADAVAGLLCRLHKLDGMGGDHFRESTKMMGLSREDAMRNKKPTFRPLFSHKRYKKQPLRIEWLSHTIV